MAFAPSGGRCRPAGAPRLLDCLLPVLDSGASGRAEVKRREAGASRRRRLKFLPLSSGGAATRADLATL